MYPNAALVEAELPLLTPDIVGHVAETLAERRHLGTMRELAMTCRANLHAAVPALYREIDFDGLKPNAKLIAALAEGDSLGTNRHAFIRKIRGADIARNAALMLIAKASSLVSLATLSAGPRFCLLYLPTSRTLSNSI